jgi:hypothetical protein
MLLFIQDRQRMKKRRAGRKRRVHRAFKGKKNRKGDMRIDELSQCQTYAVEGRTQAHDKG